MTNHLVLNVFFCPHTLHDPYYIDDIPQHFKRQQRLIPEKTIWKYFVQICSALDHMHSKRIMHRGLLCLVYFSQALVYIDDAFYSPIDYVTELDDIKVIGT